MVFTNQLFHDTFAAIVAWDYRLSQISGEQREEVEVKQ